MKICCSIKGNSKFKSILNKSQLKNFSLVTRGHHPPPQLLINMMLSRRSSSLSSWSRYLLCKDSHACRLLYSSSTYATSSQPAHKKPHKEPHKQPDDKPHHTQHIKEHKVPLTKQEVTAREKFNTLYSRSISDPEKFWGEAAENIVWYDTQHMIITLVHSLSYITNIIIIY